MMKQRSSKPGLVPDTVVSWNPMVLTHNRLDMLGEDRKKGHVEGYRLEEVNRQYAWMEAEVPCQGPVSLPGYQALRCTAGTVRIWSARRPVIRSGGFAAKGPREPGERGCHPR